MLTHELEHTCVPFQSLIAEPSRQQTTDSGHMEAGMAVSRIDKQEVVESVGVEVTNIAEVEVLGTIEVEMEVVNHVRVEISKDILTSSETIDDNVTATMQIAKVGDSVAEKVEISVDLSATETLGVVLQVGPTQTEFLLLDVVLS